MDPTQKQNDVLGNQPSVNGPSGVGYPPVAGSQPVVSDGSSVGNSPVLDTRPLMVNQSLVGDSPTVSSQSPMGVSNTGGLMDAGGVNGPVGVGISNQPMNAGQFGGLNNIGNQSMPMSTGMGDIILEDTTRKNKKGLVIGILVATIGIIIGIISFFSVFLNETQKTKNAFFDLRYYLEEGNSSGDDMNGLIYAVSIGNDDGNAIADYYRVLMEKKERFLNTTKGLDESIVGKYNSTLNILYGLMNYEDAKKKIIDLYKYEGFDAAKTFFEKNIDCRRADERIENMCNAEMNYYDSIVARFAMYHDNDCVKGEMLDEMCLREKTDNTDSIIEVSEMVDDAERMFVKLHSDEWYEILSNEVRLMDEEMMEVLKNA